MSNIEYCRASSPEELQQIIELQRRNIPEQINLSEKEKEGFVTVVHTLDLLTKMNDAEAHIIAKDGEKVVGYTLSMTREFGNDIEVLVPMFRLLDKTLPENTNYIVMGQVCVDKEYRKQGIFRGLYQHMKTSLQSKYNLLITEIDVLNTRSIQAHAAVGFKTLKQYHANGQDWELVVWDWG